MNYKNKQKEFTNHIDALFDVGVINENQRNEIFIKTSELITAIVKDFEGV